MKRLLAYPMIILILVASLWGTTGITAYAMECRISGNVTTSWVPIDGCYPTGSETGFLSSRGCCDFSVTDFQLSQFQAHKPLQRSLAQAIVPLITTLSNALIGLVIQPQRVVQFADLPPPEPLAVVLAQLQVYRI